MITNLPSFLVVLLLSVATGLGGGLGIAQWIAVFVEGGRSITRIVILSLYSLGSTWYLVVHTKSPELGVILPLSFAIASLTAFLGNLPLGWFPAVEVPRTRPWLAPREKPPPRGQYSLRQLFGLVTLCAIASAAWRNSNEGGPIWFWQAGTTAVAALIAYWIATRMFNLSALSTLANGIALCVWLICAVLFAYAELILLPLNPTFYLGICLSIHIDREMALDSDHPQ